MPSQGIRIRIGGKLWKTLDHLHCALYLGPGEVRILEDGSGEFSPQKIGFGEVATFHFGHVQPGLGEFDPLEVLPCEVDAPEVRPETGALGLGKIVPKGDVPLVQSFLKDF